MWGAMVNGRNDDHTFIRAASELLASAWTRIVAKFLNAAAIRTNAGPGSRFNSFSALSVRVS